MQVVNLTCAYCKQSFSRRKSLFDAAQKVGLKAAYCCREHLHLAGYRRKTIPCQQCHTPVSRRLSDFHSTKVFCSDACSRTAIHQKAFYTASCMHCGIIFERRTRFAKTHKVFCSSACRMSHALPVPVWHPEATIAAYLAGITDGEGSIMVYHRKTATPQLAVSIANTYKPLIDFIHDLFPGISHVILHKNKPHHKIAWALHMRGNQAEGFLLPLFPFLLIKKEQAKLGIAFNRLPYKERRYENQGQTYYEQFKQLNQRGKRLVK